MPAFLILASCSSSPPGKPNVLLVVVSGARPDHMSAYGYARRTTPALERLAASGTLFESAVTPAPWPLSANASIMTGLFTSEHLAAFDHPALLDAHETLAEKMKATGYETFGVCTDELLSRANGFAQGFDRFQEVRPAEQGLPDDGAAAAESELTSWLAGRSGDAPFFAQVILTTPRLPFNPQGEYRRQFIEREIPIPRLDQIAEFWIPFARRFTVDMETLTPDEMAALVSLYDGEIAYTDYRIGRILDALEKQDLLDQTLVVVTGDAGEDLGDHGLLADVSHVWDTIVRVPLVMRLPGRVPKGVREPAQVQTVDLARAILAMTSGGPEGAAPPEVMPRRETAVIEARWEPAAVRFYASVMPPAEAAIFMRNLLAVRTADQKYILNSRGGEALFDLKADPGEKRSIGPEKPEEARALAARLNTWASTLKPPTGQAPAAAGTPAALGAPPPGKATR